MKVSIITVAWNSNKTIKDTIESVISQTYSNVEYIIVDGGSSDRTIDTVRSYANKISQFVSEPDEGIYDAMNKGIKLATGDIIGILNSDDFFSDNEVISSIVEAFTKTQADCVYGDLIYVDYQNTSKIVRYWQSQPFVSGLFQKGWHPAHPTFYVKKSHYEQYGLYNNDLKIAADYELMLRFLEKYHLTSTYLPKTLVTMRMGGASNQSVRNIIKANKESRQAWKLNELTPPYFILIRKPLSKIKQLFKI